MEAGPQRVAIGKETFEEPFSGVSWLGSSLITPAIMLAYIWVWAGFAMVVIGAGLAAIPRDLLEAARTDGATERQVFRRVTVPLLRPVLVVVFVTMLINVLKVFDIVLSVAPGIESGRGERDRTRDVAHLVRRGERLRPRIGDRGLPVPARDPDPAAQHQELQEGVLMAASASRVFARAPLNLLLLFIGLLWLVPTLGLFLDSLLAPDVIGTTGWWKIFTEPSLATFENYSNVLDNSTLTSALGTTLLVAVFGTAIPIFVGALAGYAFAWIEFPGREWLFLGVVALLVVPLQMALIPMFSLYNNLGLFDTALALILFHSAFGLPFAIFLLRNFFVGIPKDLLESARIDGASELTIFFRLILPLGLPAIASLAIFQFLWTWNDFLVALTFGRDTQVITVAIFSEFRQFGANLELIAPAAFISLVVPLALFFAFQRYFVEGLLAGSVK